QPLERRRDLCERRVGIEGVREVDVDVVDAEPVEAGLELARHPRARKAPVCALLHRIERLRDDLRTVAAARHPLADPGLAAPAAVGVRRVERAHPERPRGVHQLERLLFRLALPEEQAFELMDAAWSLGMRTFDTADAYGGGRSETWIGKWMASRGNRPEIVTKTFNPMEEGADRGLSRPRMTRQLESSLDRLGVDYVDVYLAHAFDPDTPLAQVAATFEGL